MPIGEYALPLATAANYARTFVSYIDSEGMTYPVSKAFSIRASTLYQAMGLAVPSGVEDKCVRAYLGMDENNAYHLLFTPVEHADMDAGIPGDDVILNGDFKEGAASSPLPVQTGDYVLDFTSPCPSFCNPGSPLLF